MAILKAPVLRFRCVWGGGGRRGAGLGFRVLSQGFLWIQGLTCGVLCCVVCFACVLCCELCRVLRRVGVGVFVVWLLCVCLIPSST